MERKMKIVENEKHTL